VGFISFRQENNNLLRRAATPTVVRPALADAVWQSLAPTGPGLISWPAVAPLDSIRAEVAPAIQGAEGGGVTAPLSAALLCAAFLGG